MSAYAFPGLLLPPTTMEMGGVDSAMNNNNNNMSNAFVDYVGNNDDVPTSTGPLHERNEISFSGLLRASVDLLSVPSFTASGDTSRGFGDVGSSRTSCSDDSRSEEPGIAVKEARIDPVRFIQRVTGTGPRSQVRKTLRRRGSRERLGSPEAMSSSSQQPSPLVTKPSVVFHEEEKLPSMKSGNASPHDDAISFELSISCNGRKYTATRTLQCIFQLRDDLIQEMNARRRWLRLRRATSTDTFVMSLSGSFEETDGTTPTSTVTSGGGGGMSHSIGTNPEDMTIEIPEIPPLVDEEESIGNSGFVGRGFTMLHALATSYVPVMERWLRNVMTIVPQDSECLMNFLWEPLTTNDVTLMSWEVPSSKSCNNNNSLAGLGSIKELDYKTDESEDEDDDESDDWR